MVKWILIAVLTLVVGLAAGFFIGRYTLERQWRQPVMMVTPEMEKRAQAGDADPTPKAGSRILIPMPLERTRLVARDIVKKDPLVAIVSTVGNGEDGSELHLRVENRGTCKVVGYEGIAYGFDEADQELVRVPIKEPLFDRPAWDESAGLIRNHTP